MHGYLRALEDARDLIVLLGDADGGVDHEQHDVGRRDRALGLRAHLSRQRRRIHGLEAGREPTPRVDHPELAAVPVRFELLAVARDAGLLLDDRTAPPDEPVHERRLADVGPADHGDDGRCGHRPEPVSAQRADERRAVGGDDLDREREVGQREAVEEASAGEHDVRQQVAGVGGRG